jgi:hypothetical protein
VKTFDRSADASSASCCFRLTLGRGVLAHGFTPPQARENRDTPSTL